jgi:hypothetical protein
VCDSVFVVVVAAAPVDDATVLAPVPVLPLLACVCVGAVIALDASVVIGCVIGAVVGGGIVVNVVSVVAAAVVAAAADALAPSVSVTSIPLTSFTVDDFK